MLKSVKLVKKIPISDINSCLDLEVICIAKRHTLQDQTTTTLVSTHYADINVFLLSEWLAKWHTHTPTFNNRAKMAGQTTTKTCTYAKQQISNNCSLCVCLHVMQQLPKESCQTERAYLNQTSAHVRNRVCTHTCVVFGVALLFWCYYPMLQPGDTVYGSNLIN